MKAIYEAKGKAAEYAKYGISIYIGCSNKCEYCYLKKGRFKNVLGGNIPHLKKCFKDEEHAIEIFEKELKSNLEEFRKYGLFLTFTSDPFLPETQNITAEIIGLCAFYEVPLKILTKRAEWASYFIDESHQSNNEKFVKDLIKYYMSFGFTLTGADCLEPNASTNKERIEAMKKLHDAGFKTFASIEPVIDFQSSFEMVNETIGFCDLYLIGLRSGQKYDKDELRRIFVDNIISVVDIEAKIYFKDSLLKTAEIKRESLPENCVDRNFKL
jgi:DNA repair photolyase